MEQIGIEIGACGCQCEYPIVSSHFLHKNPTFSKDVGSLMKDCGHCCESREREKKNL